MGRGRSKRAALLARATLTKKGQITVPSSVRQRMGIGPGDQIGFRVDGRLLALPRVSLSALAGVMPPRSGRSRTFDELRQEISDELSDEMSPTGTRAVRTA